MPEEMRNAARAIMDTVPPHELFVRANAGYQLLRDRWCAGMFGIGYEKFIDLCEVAVPDTRDIDADFYLRTGDLIFSFQVVEAMERGRLRGDEYKAFAAGTLKTLAYAPEKGRIEGPAWIAEAVARKNKKKYSGSHLLNLLVYANFTAHSLNYEGLVEATKDFAGRFASIWMITDRHIATLLPNDALGSVFGLGEIFPIGE
jgi:hypothetical protein